MNLVEFNTNTIHFFKLLLGTSKENDLFLEPSYQPPNYHLTYKFSIKFYIDA